MGAASLTVLKFMLQKSSYNKETHSTTSGITRKHSSYHSVTILQKGFASRLLRTECSCAFLATKTHSEGSGYIKDIVH